MPGADATKPVWREWARAHRANTDAARTGPMIADGLREWAPYAAARRVLVYLAFGAEPDLGPLLSDDSKSFYTTRTATAGEPSLTLHRLDLDALERHRYGFLQPQFDAPAESTNQLDLVLVPGLAFDHRGNRLGFGMGFYDRLLGTIEDGVPRVGVTASSLLVPQLPSEAHDIAMSHLATEDGVFPVAAATPWSR